MSGEITGYKYTPAVESTSKKEPSIPAKISFTNSEGKTTEFKSSAGQQKIFELFDKYATKESPNITPEEIVDLRCEFSKKFMPLRAGRHSATVDYYKGVNFLLDTFTSEASEGGKNITPKEVAHIFEVFKEW